ncbi:hypothetical protein FUSO7_03890 [Fusobacterium necrophorum BFTR-2]|nr:ABC transporter permease [Fusobacterium necrophorum]KDE74242.1 hypothetical protein FUSO7_03890 [Fusobacterium necrophorum BFTR-2]
MEIINIFWRNYRWRRKNLLSIIVTILQPVLWLVLYGSIASNAVGKSFSVDYISFIIPGLLVLVTFSSSSSGGMINYIMKKNGSFKRLVIAPIKRESIVCGQIMEATACSVFESFILIIIGWILGANYNFSLITCLLIIFLVILTGLTFSSIAYYISLKAFNEVLYETIMNSIVLPIFFLSSALFPVNNVSGCLKIIINLNIFNHVIDLIRQLVQGEIYVRNYIIISAILLIIINVMVVINSKQLEKVVRDL